MWWCRARTKRYSSISDDGICDRDYLQALLDVEVALAIAEAEVGVIPASCVPAYPGGGSSGEL